MITIKDIEFKDIPLPPIEARDKGATAGKILLTHQIRWSKNPEIRTIAEDTAKRDIEIALMCRIYGEIGQLIPRIRLQVFNLKDMVRFYMGIVPHADTEQLLSDLARIQMICRGEAEIAER